MFFVRFFSLWFFSLSLWFSIFFATQTKALTSQEQSSACDCEAIKQERYCDNPDCIQICNLEDLFYEINSTFLMQCLPGKNESETIRDDNISITKVEEFLRSAKASILEIQDNDEKELDKNCPGCDFDPEIKVHLHLKPYNKSCPEEYIKEHHYKKTHRLELESPTCDTEKTPKQFRSRARSKKTEEPEGCPDKQSQNSGSENLICNKEKIHEEFENYMKSILIDKKTKESKDLHKSCPTPCSFDSVFYVKIDEKTCEGKLNATVLCTHPKRGLLGPIYDASVKYTRGGLQCK